MGRCCIKDHRPEHSLGNELWLNGCAQCEIERLRAAYENACAQRAAISAELAAERDRLLTEKHRAIDAHGQAVGELRGAQSFILSGGTDEARAAVLAFTGGSVFGPNAVLTGAAKRSMQTHGCLSASG